MIQNHHHPEPNNTPIVNKCMRLILLSVLFNFQSFGQQDSLNTVICQMIQHAKKPVNSPPIYYFPFYNGIQLIEVDYYTYLQRDYTKELVKTSENPFWYSKQVNAEEKNGYILRNSTGKVLKAYGIRNASGTYLLPPDEAPVITHKEHLNSQKNQSVTWKEGNGYGYRFAVTTIRERRTEMPEQAYHIFGMLDTLGNVVIPPTHRTIEYFQGEYLAMLDISNTYAIYDSTFHKTVGYSSDNIERIGYNRYAVYGKNGGIMNRNGEFIMRYPFNSLRKSPFSTDFIYSIESHEPKFGILSEDLMFKTEPVYRRVGALQGGYAVFTARSNQFAIVNMSGQQITGFEFEYSRDLTILDGTFTLLKTTDAGNKYGMIDTLGNTIIPFIYDKIHPFNKDIVIVELNQKMGIADRRGNLVLPIEYELIHKPVNGVLLVRKNGKYGSLNEKFEVIEPLVHSNYRVLSNGKYEFHETQYR
jgi:hypothetical protein